MLQNHVINCVNYLAVIEVECLELVSCTSSCKIMPISCPLYKFHHVFPLVKEGMSGC